jgi:hypothetical protein
MRYTRLLSLLAAVWLGGIPAAPALNVTFSNSSGISGSNVWVMFGGQNNSTLSGTLTYSGTTQSIAYGQSYQLSEISGPINLIAATAGKIFVSYGANLNSDGSQYSLPGLPDFQYNSLDPRWQVRWDKVEYSLFSSTSQQSAINLSAVDFYSIPMQIVTSQGGVATGTVGWHPQTSTSTVFYNLGSLATGTNSIYAVITSTSASPYSVQVTFSNSTTLNTLRIANPSAITQAVPNPFPSLLPYALSTSGTGSTPGTSGTTANLTSYYVGAGTTSNGLPAQAWAAQSYAFTSTVTPSGNMVISGSGQQVGTQTITIQEQDLEGALYSNAPDYYLSSYNSGSSPLQNSNCVYDQIISDVFAAYNMGLVGSTVTDPRYPGTAVGTESSGQWYSVVGTSYYGNPLFTPEQLFANMQPKSPKATPYYNAFAGYLAPISDIYGFPYTDKSAKPQLNITPGSADTMVITLLPDVVPVSDAVNPGPNQLPIAIRDNQFSLSYLSVRGKPALNTSGIKLHLQINHPRISDLTVRLVSPSGKTYLIHDRTGGTSANLILPGVSLPESRKETRQNGLWMLVVKDSKRGDTGQLIQWSLEFP